MNTQSPTTEAGRALLRSLHAQAPVVVPLEQDAAAILAIEEAARAEGRREAVDNDAFRDALSSAMQDHILDKRPGKGWPHPRSADPLARDNRVEMRDGCDDLCSDDIVDRLVAILDASESPPTRCVVCGVEKPPRPEYSDRPPRPPGPWTCAAHRGMEP